jgi:hypothetical protein
MGGDGDGDGEKITIPKRCYQVEYRLDRYEDEGSRC